MARGEGGEGDLLASSLGGIRHGLTVVRGVTKSKESIFLRAIGFGAISPGLSVNYRTLFGCTSD